MILSIIVSTEGIGILGLLPLTVLPRTTLLTLKALDKEALGPAYPAAMELVAATGPAGIAALVVHVWVVLDVGADDTIEACQ